MLATWKKLIASQADKKRTPQTLQIKTLNHTDTFHWVLEIKSVKCC